MPQDLRKICDEGRLLELAEEYVKECYERDFIPDGKKQRSRFPNIAGFCRRLGIGVACIKRVRDEYPEQYGTLLSLFEDEALNSTQSATIISAYLKEHLDFGEKKEEGTTLSAGDIKLVFEHDIWEDGE